MTRKWKWFFWIALASLGLLVLAVLIALETGAVGSWTRSAIVRQLERITGGRVELDSFRFDLFTLNVKLGGLTIHGLEPQGTPPLFHVDNVNVKLVWRTLLRRRHVDLSQLEIVRPAVHIRVDQKGHSNVPAVRRAQTQNKPWHERLFSVTIRQLRLNDGYVLYNDVRVPLAVEGGAFAFNLDYYAPLGGEDFYQGALNWKQMEVAARRYFPFRSDLNAQFTITRSQLKLNAFRLNLPHTEIEARAELASFAKPDWAFHYRARLDLADVRTILRKPSSPGGEVESTGNVNYGGGQWNLQGYYHARKLSFPYQWFHANGIESRGSLLASGHALQIPDFQGWALGGQITGRVDFEFHGQQFRAATRARGMSLAAILAAVDNKDFPMHTLHWNSSVDVDSLTTWLADFKHMVSSGQSIWSASAVNAGEIPASAEIHYKYSMDQKGVTLRQSHITTPTTRVEMDGILSAHDSSLTTRLEEQNLLVWNDFINYMRKTESKPERISGRASWNGSVQGELSRPTFSGHVHGFGARYEKMNWDEIEGEMTYSPDELALSSAQLRRGNSTAAMDLHLELDDWSFLPESHWNLKVHLTQADTDDLQDLFGSYVTAQGVLTGDFTGSGTRGDPQLHGDLMVVHVNAWNFRFDQVRGLLDIDHGQVRITHAELRQDPGRISGDFSYVLRTGEITFHLIGDALPLARIQQIQTVKLPLDGRFGFDIEGHGPFTAPETRGSFALTNLRVGKEILGNFAGRITSDGRRVQLNLSSAMNGKLGGSVALTLAGNYPLQGELTVEQMDLNPFIATGLHLTALTKPSEVTGRFTINGALRAPETITVQADISNIVFEYENVKLENVGPVRLLYQKSEVRVQQAQLRGQDTDVAVAGSVRFDRKQPMDFNLSGTVNLQLIQGFVSSLESHGTARMNARFQGTLSDPRITGRVQIVDASVRYGDFPSGLSQVNGELVFDRTRLSFDNLTATAGSGSMVLSGSVSYGEGPLSYDIHSQSGEIRIRYPEGMSWMISGNLQLSGTKSGAQLSGNVTIHRLLMTRGLNVAAVIIGARESVRPSVGRASFLDNLRLDLAVFSGADARMEWTGTRVDLEGNLRVRGTWEHPSVLGHVHLLSGEVMLRGNRYRLERGDINFANPFRLDPILDIEATSNIQQYEVTMDFTGPASAPHLSYRSDPPLPESDVLSLLALGRTGAASEVRTATGTSSAQSGAGTLLSEAISSQIGGRLQQLFGISRFQVDPFVAGVGTEPNAAARITVQQQVSHDLSITYSTNAASNPQEVIQVEYAVSRDISIVALRDINGTFGLDVIFKKRFK